MAEALKFRLELKRIGGSTYILLPSGLVGELGMQDDEEVLVTLERCPNLIKDLCKKYQKSAVTVLITLSDDKKMSGLITKAEKNTITYYSDKKYFILEYSQIKSIEEFT